MSFKVPDDIFLDFNALGCQNSCLGKQDPGVEPTKLFFLRFFFFGVKLGHFSINNFFSVCNKNASLPAKNGKILR